MEALGAGLGRFRGREQNGLKPRGVAGRDDPAWPDPARGGGRAFWFGRLALKVPVRRHLGSAPRPRRQLC